MAASSYAHRTRPGARSTGYNLRGLPITAAISTPHPSQVTKNTVARQIRNGWPITRRSRRSRGLSRNNNTCFRVSGLQALFHLPKFLQWIISHNSTQNDTVVFPCSSVSDYQTELIRVTTSGGSDSDDEEDEETKKLTQCPACAVKALAQCYWGDGDLNATGEPMPLSVVNPQPAAVHNVDDVLRMFTPGVGTEDPQEDPEEMQTRLLRALLESVDHTLAVNTTWRTRYEALFTVQLEMTRRCACGALRPLPPGTNTNDIGFRNIAVLPKGRSDSVAAAIHRNFNPVVLGNFGCTSCNTSRPLTETIRIEGSPEYLRIKLSIVDTKGKKNTNPIVLNEYLDLSQYQAIGGSPPLLKYRLNSVLYHLGGGLGSGHWTASARGPGHVFYINDEHAVLQKPSQLRNNPQRGAEAAVLMYKRVHTR